jgi:hypothetical protein
MGFTPGWRGDPDRGMAGQQELAHDLRPDREWQIQSLYSEEVAEIDSGIEILAAAGTRIGTMIYEAS